MKALARDVVTGAAIAGFPTVSFTPASLADVERVRIGNLSPSFPPVKVAPANLADAKKVRIGNLSPSFPPLRSRT